MEKYNTIHIFGYGETQLIDSDLSLKVKSQSLSKLLAVIDNIYSKKPLDNTSKNEYHSINIFNDSFVDFIPNIKGEKPFRIKHSELDSSLINDLILEIKESVSKIKPSK